MIADFFFSVFKYQYLGKQNTFNMAHDRLENIGPKHRKGVS